MAFPTRLKLTAGTPPKQNSNVVELCSRLIKDDTQLTFYTSGIGTFVSKSKSWLSYARLKKALKHVIDMAIAKFVSWHRVSYVVLILLRYKQSNLQARIFSAYEWLSENYQPGDRIFLFGPSFMFSFMLSATLK